MINGSIIIILILFLNRYAQAPEYKFKLQTSVTIQYIQSFMPYSTIIILHFND